MKIKKSIKEYTLRKITFSEAAHKSNVPLVEMEKYLVENGFKSSYSTEDFEREMKLLE